MNIRLTKKRKQILDILKENSRTFSAKEIHAELPTIDLVTIYRNLELFQKANMITAVHIHADETHYEYQHEPHHHAICTDCNRVIHFPASSAQLKKILQLTKFDMHDIEVTVRGSCGHTKQHHSTTAD